MIYNSNIANDIAKILLEIEAVKLQTQKPFTWASGWKSPIYCDNRKILSFPFARNIIKQNFASLIKNIYPEVEVIAGVATGAIAHGALVADYLDCPFVYVRFETKSHGLENQVEGKIEKGQKVVVIEDLISTGGSSLKSVDALQKAGCNVLGMCAIFTYNFQIAEDNFYNKSCELYTLSDYNTLIEIASEIKYITDNEIPILKKWRSNPEKWGL